MEICEYRAERSLDPRLLTPTHFHSWSRLRRASHDALTKREAQRYYPIQIKEANILITSLLTNPKDRKQHFMRAGASTIMAMVYDYPTLPSAHDEAIGEIDKNFQQGSQAVNLGASLVDFLPWMLHIPQRYGLSLQFKDRTYLISDESLDLRSGREKRWNTLPSVPSCIYDYSTVSEPILYVLVSECVWCPNNRAA